MSNPADLPYEVTREVRDGCLCLHAQRAARLLARRFDAAFRHLGLTNGQFSLLMSLNRPEPAPMRQVATLLAMDRTTLTANLKPLERRGLLKIETDADDRRSKFLRLTRAGRDLMVKAMPVWTETHAVLDRLVTASGLDELRTDLRALS